MAKTSARMLRLLSLLETHRYWPGAELADRLQVSQRTLRRDIDRLRELGYPVQAQRGVTGGYQLAAGAALPPLLVDDEEAVALAVGLQAAAESPVEGIAESSVRALAKVVQVMPAGTPSGSASVTPRRTASGPPGTWSRTGWSRSAAAGTWSATTSAGMTGAATASTASPGRRAPAPGSGRASCPPPTPPRSSGPASAACPPSTTSRS